MKYRKKAVEVEAMQLTKDNRKEVLAFIGSQNCKSKSWDPVNIHVQVMDGGERALVPGDYVVKHDPQTVEVLPREYFEIHYEKIQPTASSQGQPHQVPPKKP